MERAAALHCNQNELHLGTERGSVFVLSLPSLVCEIKVPFQLTLIHEYNVSWAAARESASAIKGPAMKALFSTEDNRLSLQHLSDNSFCLYDLDERRLLSFGYGQ